MTRLVAMTRVLATLVCATLLGSCQAIAGIEERHFDGNKADAGSGDAGEPLASKAQCKSFCADVFEQCKKGELVPYVSEDACVAVCQNWAPGDLDAKDPKGNNLACRAHQIDLKRILGDDDTAQYCRAAGVGGSGLCGSDCEGYCELYDRVCSPLGGALTIPDSCVTSCEGLANDGTFNTVDADTFQCRAYHLTNSAIAAPDLHCGHAVLAHPTLHCFDAEDEKPSCKHYCELVTSICREDLAVYESQAQCEAVCALLDPGVNGGQTASPDPAQGQDTIGCRQWHAYTSATLPKNHCPHSGPTGDGHCTDGSEAPNCAPYCRIMEKTCPAAFADAFEDAAGCAKACAKLDGSAKDSGYTVETAVKAQGKLQCRVLYAARAAASGNKNAPACMSAIGKADCE